MTEKRAARVEPGGGASDAAENRRRTHYSTPRHSGQGKKRGATGAVTLRGRDFYVGRRKVARLRGLWLWRALTSEDQLLQGAAVSFRAEVLATARRHAPRGVCVRLPNGDIATAGWPTWDAFGFDYEHPTFGPQRALALARWYRPGGPRVWQAALRLGGGE
jgi:hypothetical protein